MQFPSREQCLFTTEAPRGNRPSARSDREATQKWKEGPGTKGATRAGLDSAAAANGLEKQKAERAPGYTTRRNSREATKGKVLGACRFATFASCPLAPSIGEILYIAASFFSVWKTNLIQAMRDPVVSWKLI